MEQHKYGSNVTGGEGKALEIGSEIGDERPKTAYNKLG